MVQEKMIIGIVSGVTIAAVIVAGVGFGWTAKHRRDLQSTNVNQAIAASNANTNINANADAAMNIPQAEDLPATDTDQQGSSATDTKAMMTVKLSFVLLNDQGAHGKAVGCGDSISSVDLEIPATANPARAAIQQLLSVKEQYYGKSELYNALYQSDLRVEQVAVEHGRAVVYLVGTLMSGGTCDDPRIAEQITQTALQFLDIETVDIFVNDTPIDTLLSGFSGEGEE